MTKISVVMNCYNGQAYVKEAIDSVFAQSVPHWEIVFWDNASTDRTADIAAGYKHDPRFRYFRGERNVPLGEARRMAMREARGEWIAFADHDDVCLPERFERQLVAVGSGDFVLCYGGMREIDESGAILRDVLPRHRTGDLFPSLLMHFEANLQTTMLRRAALERCGLEFDPTYRMFEDFDLFMRLAAKGRVCVVPEILCLCRVLKTSQSEKTLEHHARERRTTLARLRAENAGIEARYPHAFREAEARAAYYQARWEMQSGRAREARTTMRGIARVAPLYALLWLMSFSPALWNLAHDRHTKQRLTGVLLRLPFLRPGRAANHRLPP